VVDTRPTLTEGRNLSPLAEEIWRETLQHLVSEDYVTESELRLLDSLTAETLVDPAQLTDVFRRRIPDPHQ
jgi:hypothetical protein